MKPRSLKQYADEEIQYAADVQRVQQGVLTEEACYEIIARLTAVKQTVPNYRENELNVFIANAYYQAGIRFVRADDMQSALDNFQQAAALLPKETVISDDVNIPKEAAVALAASIEECIREIKSKGLRVFTDEPPTGIRKPVASYPAAQSPTSTLKKHGSFAQSPDSAFQVPREESSSPKVKNKGTKKTGL